MANLLVCYDTFTIFELFHYPKRLHQKTRRAMYTDYDESPYIKALLEISSDGFEERDWLYRNFKLYKKTLNWPYNLPPIGRSNLVKGTLREKFHSTYQEILAEFEYILNLKLKTLEIK